MAHQLGQLAPELLRALMTAARFPAVAHAARRLHVSQAILLERIGRLQSEFGMSAIQVQSGRIVIAADLMQAMEAAGGSSRTVGQRPRG
jgi:DNA-binding transcriptional LysR family regulator